MNKVAANTSIKIGQKPVVILPLEEYEWRQEDLEMLRSKKLPKRVAKARADIKAGKFVTLDEVKKNLNIKTRKLFLTFRRSAT